MWNGLQLLILTFQGLLYHRPNRGYTGQGVRALGPCPDLKFTSLMVMGIGPLMWPSLCGDSLVVSFSLHHHSLAFQEFP